MKTYKQKYEQAVSDYKKLHELYVSLNEEHHNLLKNEVGVLDTMFMRRLVETLQDIRKNGGAYSSVKAVELLYSLGSL